jgi:hypothetical protein
MSAKLITGLPWSGKVSPLKSLSRIPPSKTVPKCGQFCLLKYDWIPGQPAIETLPALVVRSTVCPLTDHQLVNVVPFGDGLPDGVWQAPVSGVGEPLNGLYLFDALGGVIPEVEPRKYRDGMFATRRVWCEWEPIA